MSPQVSAESPADGSPADHLSCAFGLRIASELPLPELDAIDPSQSAAPDVSIRFATLDGPLPDPPELRAVRVSADSLYLAWRMLGRIAIHADAIALDPLPGVDRGGFNYAVLGPAIAALLHLRGSTVLHGSALALQDGRAVLFLGDNHAGKSTLAAACIKAGLSLISDDVIALPAAGDRPASVQPGFPSMKLGRSVVERFHPLPGALLPAVPVHAAKLRLRLPPMEMTPRALAHIFVLRRAADSASPVQADALDASARLTMLMRYAYMPKLDAALLTGAAGIRHFRACAAVANAVPLSILTVPNAIDRLVDVPESLPALVDAG